MQIETDGRENAVSLGRIIDMVLDNAEAWRDSSEFDYMELHEQKLMEEIKKYSCDIRKPEFDTLSGIQMEQAIENLSSDLFDAISQACIEYLKNGMKLGAELQLELLNEKEKKIIKCERNGTGKKETPAPEPETGVKPGDKALVYNRLTEYLIDISLVFARMQAGNEMLFNFNIITWKEMFVDWANEFEAERADTDWNEADYLEEIERYARWKILECVGLEDLLNDDQ